MKESVLKEKSYAFALRIVKLYQHLAKEQHEYVISKQILRSGTSIGANIEEAGQAQSKPDFIHKLSIAQKESFETHYWLRLLRDSSLFDSQDRRLNDRRCSRITEADNCLYQNIKEESRITNLALTVYHLALTIET